MNSATTARFPLGPLLVLAGAVFASVTSEFLPTGLLPEMAAELGVSESRIGLLVALFAMTVTVTAVPLTLLTARIPRKPLMLALLGGFAVANLASALAPTYELLMGARILGGACHGLFWAVTGPYAAHLVSRARLARALSIVNGGGTMAFILGVPIAAALGHALGWRAAFGVMSGVVLVFLVLVALLLPAIDHRPTLATAELAIPARRDPTLVGVAIAAATVVVFVVGHNALYTYIAPWLIGVGGVPGEGVSAVLFAFGAAGAVGVVLAAVLGDRFPRAAVVVALAGVVIAGVALATLAPGSAPVSIALLVLWSASFGGLPALVHARMLHTASPRVRDLAAAIITIAFNSGIALGALVGGALLDRVGLAALPWAMVAIMVLALVVVLVTDPIRERLHPQRHHPRGA